MLAVYCLVKNHGQVSSIVHSLREAGFADDSISVLFPDRSNTEEFTHEQRIKQPDGAAAGVSVGSVAGGAVGWLAGAGALLIPGVGPFFAAGPLLTALGGAAVGAAFGGLTGSLTSLGVPEYEARIYEGKIRDGRILISADAKDGEWARRAKVIMKRAGAEDVTCPSPSGSFPQVGNLAGVKPVNI